MRAKKSEASKDREKRIAKTVRDLLDLEDKCGHSAVFAALRAWLNKPLRGQFK